MDQSLKQVIAAQERAMNAVRAAKYVASVISGVGTGKGRIMLLLAAELVEKYNIQKILYLCDNTRLRDEDFPEEVKKWAPQLIPLIRRECYQTAYKWENTEWDLLLADEVDFALSQEFGKVFFNNRFKYKILLTGTLKEEKRPILEMIAPIVYRLTTTESERLGIVNKSIYYIYNYQMTQEESRKYEMWTHKIQASKAKGDNIKTQNFFTSKRREILYNLDSSVKHSRKVMQWMWNKNKGTRLVIFSERTEQADKLCKYSYHGGNDKENNLKKFQDGEISAVSVVSKIKRGINLKNANSAIFEMLNGGSTTEFMQENGRMKRLPKSQVATIVFMIPWYEATVIDADGNKFKKWKPTVVKSWLNQATSELEDITFVPLKF